jgi:predicted O-methyltransferase YrrM
MRSFSQNIFPFVRALKRRFKPRSEPFLAWIRHNPESWLERNLTTEVIQITETDRHQAIEAIAAAINNKGPQPLWHGYEDVYRKDRSVPHSRAPLERMPDQVRTQPEMGRFFCWLAEKRAPSLVVEIGTAFGISTRYWAEGIKAAHGGRLLTFEANDTWHKIASAHLADYEGIVVTNGELFEVSIDSCLRPGEKIDIAFVDAIHTDDAVSRQIEILIQRLNPRGLILVDDISFSDDMKRCWSKWASDARVSASVAVSDRVGIIELAL